jgi:hypothetical protein
MASGPATRLATKKNGPAITLALLTGFALCVFVAFWLLDFFVLDAAHAGGKGPFLQLLDYDAETMQNALGTLAQVIAAVLGIAITVVSIVVQLAANRYTSRVTDMFFRDKTNLFVMGFFVVACIEALWVTFGVGKEFVPRGTITVALVMATASLLLLVPYFGYVFDFLDPEKVIARLGAQTLESAAPRKRAEPDGGAAALEARQMRAVSGLEQLAGIAMNALAQKEKTIATDATVALRTVLVDYLPEKQGLPAAWFGLGRALRGHPDFVAMAPESLDELARDRAWLEWMGLRQIREVFGEALKTLPEMTHVVAIDTRYVGEAAIEARDREVLALTIKFMNTYLRASLNARDVRTCYNVLHQYRQLAEAMVRAPAPALTAEPWLAMALEEVAGHFKYYAQLAHGQGLGFVTETAAYDLCTLCELASELSSPSHGRLLAIFLEIDKEAETTAEEKALRGVRKAQAKLATFYLLRGETAHARAIYEDMAQESPERLRSIRDELLAITSKHFWEVVDRGTNFDYIDDARKEKLREFFGQFESLSKLPPRQRTGTGPYSVTGS